MAIKFCLYYHTPETCEYLENIIHSSQETALVEAQPLDQLPEQVNSGTNVIFLEYLPDNPGLDPWIKKTAADHRNPPHLSLPARDIHRTTLEGLAFRSQGMFHPSHPGR